MTMTNIDDLQSRTVDWLRYPLMVLIVILHTDTALLWSMPHEGLPETLYYILRTISLVAVPLFFIFSGYWFFRQPETFTLDTYREKIRKRVRTLLIPYLFWNFFSWALQLIVVVLLGHADWIPTEVFYPKNFIDNFIGYGEGHQGMPKAFQLWFLRDLIVVCLISPLLYHLLHSKRPWLLIILAALYILPYPEQWHPIFKHLPAALLFFSAGAYMGIHKMNIVETARRVPMWLSFTVPTLLIALHVWLHSTWNPSFIYIEHLFSIVAVVPTIQVAATLVERKDIKPIGWLAGSAFLLFAIHPLITEYLVVYPISKLLVHPDHGQFWLVLAAEIVVPVVVCALLHAIFSLLMPRTTSLLTGGRVSNKSQTKQHNNG